jgi:hypothetical protein
MKEPELEEDSAESSLKKECGGFEGFDMLPDTLGHACAQVSANRVQLTISCERGFYIINCFSLIYILK